MWQEALATSKDDELHPPSPGELRAAFAAIKHGFKGARKFCFFIDGLDEYDGDCFMGASTVVDLVTNSDIKIIVSSRPIPPCVQSFGACQTLRLQDLTKGDITCYINDTVGSHPSLKYLASSQPNFPRSICDEVASKASGVFLWVVLACRSLIAGLAACDVAEDLRRRIDELPRELDKLFQHMLQKVEPRYQSQAAKLLRICYQNKLDGSPDLPSIGLAITKEAGLDLSKAVHSRPPPKDTRRLKCQILEARLRSRCCGLLELQIAYGRDRHCFCGATVKPHDHLVDSIVVFIHRTVVEFLSQRGLWDLSCLKTDDETFDAETILSYTNIKLLQITTALPYYTKDTRQQCDEHLKEILIHIKKSDESMSVKAVVHAMSYLDGLLRKTNAIYFYFVDKVPANVKHRSIFADIPIEDFPFAAAFAVEMGMANSISTLLSKAKLPKGLLSSFLFHHLFKPLTKQLQEYTPEAIHPRTACKLLFYGCNPNATCLDQPPYIASRAVNITSTPWKIWLDILQHEISPPSIEIVDTTLAFMEAGADVEVLRGQFPVVHARLLAITQQCPVSIEEKQRAKNVVLQIVRRVTDRFNENDISDPGSPPATGQSRYEEQLGSKRRISSNNEERVKRSRITDTPQWGQGGGFYAD